ncbi:carbon-nitrogen hydrolase family protein [Halovulum dunhuangense]|uniref:Carbon-nitrogen hydrolase family protein n=1 Tax=Halovulum dunhuangense TaxID=1505036 RepID=A0A849KXF5_9RHOB|nr:carbon-nitrogen hydrolase family protein [Halovulum dunhuangense]NNU79227.1 carbon-nitrogen hydrolase family protein [Halovulum dunhuangense]
MRAGLIQLTSSDDPAANLSVTEGLIRQAAADGATLIATPEVTNCISLSRARQEEVLRQEADDPTLAALSALAAELGVHVLIGSLALRTEEPRFANRSILLTPEGRIAARYDKIHMFDVDLGSESYRESDGYRPGTRATLAPLGDARLGMTICYDLRFPALYRQLAQAGASIISIPSAFTRPTGEAHWEPLLRARAIETGCFVIAPAQTGTHAARPGDRQRQTHGHSLVVDPWGRILLDMGREAGFACVDLDLDAVAAARQRVPSLRHDREYEGPGAQ